MKQLKNQKKKNEFLAKNRWKKKFFQIGEASKT